jgi:hypothetical protein
MRAKFPQLREVLREDAFSRPLRDSAGNPTGISARRHGNGAARLREDRERAGAEIISARFN